MAKFQLIVSQREYCFAHKIKGNIYGINSHFNVLLYLQKYTSQSCLNIGKFYGHYMHSKFVYKLNTVCF